jgi:ribosomal protein S10
MDNNVIQIDLNEFEGKSIYDFKMKIAETLRNIEIQYTVPSPKGERKATMRPYSHFDLSGNENYYKIEKIIK